MYKSEELYNTASIPDKSDKDILQICGEEYTHRSISSFYSEGPLETTKFHLKKNENTVETIRTHLYNVDVPLDSFEKRDILISDYSEDLLQKVGINFSGTWNGESAAFLIKDNELEVAETDFYTQEISWRLLYIEAANAVKKADWEVSNIYKHYMPLRQKILNAKSDLKNPKYVRGGDAGAVVFVKKGNNWYLLLGKRSQTTKVDRGLFSICPNGILKYSDFEQTKPFVYAASRQFQDEVSIGRKAKVIQHVSDGEFVADGFHMRDGSISVAYPVFVEVNENSDIEKEINLNEEFESIEAVNVRNFEKLTKTLRFGKTSPENIAKIILCLENYKERFNLPYEISTEAEDII